ncbi:MULTISPECIES: histidine phosphatase family protein [unclassified Enterococcus]|uniref:histidine phosphatase family protein n=1 Tax=unclassified Enterococcus TaxID=2608891 RepID=UPI001CE05CD6|nr:MULTISPECIES: histidine phosphatase family protein [unclassified Enterococcus]MCA5011528.1 histidine phosphatase family protein [Enterococcus sp. S23]MCA5015030.1 histidine phosphatase family protein [Enterococcus sp. S22(2020)]
MTQYLYLMRHGETLFNQLNKVQGACDSPLTQLGISQAHDAKEYFKSAGISFDSAFSSTQERASDTLEIITTLPYQRLKGLKEMNFGLFEAQSVFLQPKGPESFENFYVRYGGESADSVRKRVFETLTSIMQQKENTNVLAVSHNGTCFFFLSQIWKEDLGIQPIHLPNCGIIKLGFNNDAFEFLGLIDPTQHNDQD